MLPPAEPATLPSQSRIDRRDALRTVGLTGAGLLASSGICSAFSSGSGLGSLDLPDQWLERNGSAERYYRYLSSLKLKRVDAAQVIDSHAKKRGRVWNGLPPRQWWKRMGYVLKVVERIAMEMNVSEVEVVSAYRNPAYNARCRGAKSGSWHQENVAVDIKFPVRPSKVTATARQLRDLGLFRGGVGGYRNFTHIDARGRNVNW